MKNNYKINYDYYDDDDDNDDDDYDFENENLISKDAGKKQKDLEKEPLSKSIAFITIGTLTMLYVIVELGAALYVGSLTLLSDGFHNLSDVVSLVIAWWAQKAAKRDSDNFMSYGWARAEILGGLTNGCFLLSMSLYVALEAIPRFIKPEPMESGLIFMIVAGSGLAINILGTIVFACTGMSHAHSHGGGGGHSHGGGAHSHGEKKKEKHGHSHDGAEKKKEKHGHSHDGAEKKKEKHGHGHSHGTTAVGINSDEKEEHNHDDHDHHDHSEENHGHSHGGAENKKEKHGHGHSHSGGAEGINIGDDNDHDDHDHHDHSEESHGHSHGGEKKKEKHGHSHDGAEKKKEKHGHSHDGEKKKKKKKSSGTCLGMDLNMFGVFIHFLGDAISSLFVLITGAVIHFTQGKWTEYIDPAVSLIIVIMIAATSAPLVKRCSMILLQKVPDEIDLDTIRHKMLKVEGVLSQHDLHVWQLVDGMTIASVHVGIAKGKDFQVIASKLKKIFHKEGIHSTSIQPEFLQPNSFTGGASSDSNYCVQNCVDDCEEEWCCKKSADRIKMRNLPYSNIVDINDI
ncbi:hypothetical protein RB653_006225 [Dictyostelium firmibasis]|uniref:Zinc transporter n=1 Tax=Dictyostelium firmibasis TaxID=79012 RepID=A0AAN7YYW3_9MYCE